MWWTNELAHFAITIDFDKAQLVWNTTTTTGPCPDGLTGPKVQHTEWELNHTENVDSIAIMDWNAEKATEVLIFGKCEDSWNNDFDCTRKSVDPPRQCHWHHQRTWSGVLSIWIGPAKAPSGIRMWHRAKRPRIPYYSNHKLPGTHCIQLICSSKHSDLPAPLEAHPPQSRKWPV